MDKKPFKLMSPKKRVFVKITLCVLCVCLSALALFHVTQIIHDIRNTHPPGEKSAPDSIYNVFTVDDSAYYIRHDGQLYLYEESGDTHIYAFPSCEVEYSKTLGGFIYQKDSVFYLFDPQTRAITETKVINAKMRENPRLVLKINLLPDLESKCLSKKLIKIFKGYASAVPIIRGSTAAKAALNIFAALDQ